jgi:hypothetical protein
MDARFGLIALLAGCVLAAPLALAQTPAQAPAKPAAYAAPRTSSGQPSFEGVWTHNFTVLLEATPNTPKLTVSEPEAKAIGAAMGKGISENFEASLDPEVSGLMSASDGLPIVRGERRTRSVVEPADGKLPYTADARKEAQRGYGGRKFDNPEERPNWERCITSLGLPPVSGLYTTNVNPVRFIQTPGQVVVHTEYGDEARIIPFSNTHKPKTLYSPLGDSIARWDGDTLVIETIGMLETDRVRPFTNMIIPATAKVTERYTRVSDRELLYQYTVEDPTTYTAPWLAEYSLYRTDQRMYEHACHEGNYSLPNILRAERVKNERTAAAKAPVKPKGN